MADLDKLKDNIEELGERIKSLKSITPIDNDAVQTAVKDLLSAKQLYAENNNGIGVDGQPYEAPMSKADRKAKAKADKQAGPAKPEGDPESKNAEKKAAKKAAKQEKKFAIKSGDAMPADVAKIGKPTAAAATAAQTVALPPVADSTVEPRNLPTPPVAMVGSLLLPLQIAINPNVPLTERPIVALAVAVLTNTAVDLNIRSDHHCRHTMMAAEKTGETIVGDLAMARYLARRANATNLVPTESVQAALVDTWVDYALSLVRLSSEQRMNAVALTLEGALKTSTYLVGHALTLADLALFRVVGFPCQANDLAAALQSLPKQATAAKRWMNMLALHPALQEGTQLCVGIANNIEAIFDPTCVADPLVPGMNILEGAIAGRVVTRFPPEPSGYLHIGHAKAALLNDYYARRYKGRLLLRFDDTNPSKEKEEYQQSIVADLAKLEIVPDSVTYTSDYLVAITDYAIAMIKKGAAYMDDTPQEQMKSERAERQDSKHRNQTSDEALQKFALMCTGSEDGSVWCLRAKIDMKSDNGTMRDPVLFRQNLTPHHRTGTTFKAYPTYDLACPIVDSIEGVTHALRTTEYNDRNVQYQWMLITLGLRRVRISTFSRVNFVNTVLSKRKLTWFVDNGYVTGWDDARFPTVRGVVRRGVNITALRNFMLAQGASRRDVNMDWSAFWGENKKEIDKLAKRFMAVDKTAHVKLIVSNAPSEDQFAFVETTFHPKDPLMGKRALRIAREVLLESADVHGMTEGEEIVLLRWGVVKITRVGPEIEGEFMPGGDFKAAKRKLSWIAKVSQSLRAILTEFDNLVSKAKLEEDDKFEDFINPNTLATTEVIADAGCKTLREHEIIQLERRGFYRVDRPYINEDKPLILYMIPDGKSKAMSGIGGKLVHR